MCHVASRKVIACVKSELVKENLHLKAKLTDVKSLDKISKAAEKIGLTYDVVDRLFIKDPISTDMNISRRDFADNNNNRILDNLEDFVLRNGPAYAGGEQKQDSK